MTARAAEPESYIRLCNIYNRVYTNKHLLRWDQQDHLLRWDQQDADDAPMKVEPHV
jgi:hypothetical protein